MREQKNCKHKNLSLGYGRASCNYCGKIITNLNEVFRNNNEEIKRTKREDEGHGG